MRGRKRVRREHTPEDRERDAELYDVAPETMPPSPAGANADVGGEAAASRRVAGPKPGANRKEEALDTPREE